MKLRHSMKRAQYRAMYRAANLNILPTLLQWGLTRASINNYRRLRKYYALRIKP